MSRTIFGDAIFAIVFAIVMVTVARFYGRCCKGWRLDISI